MKSYVMIIQYVIWLVISICVKESWQSSGSIENNIWYQNVPSFKIRKNLKNKHIHWTPRNFIGILTVIQQWLPMDFLEIYYPHLKPCQLTESVNNIIFLISEP